MKDNVFTNCTRAYKSLVANVLDEYDYVSKPRDMEIREKIAVKFTINDPRDRLPYVPERKFSVQYYVAESLWYLSASDSTEWISNYSKFWLGISDDGTTANSAYGARIFAAHDRITPPAVQITSQWQYVIDELKSDPDSRRAVIHIRSPHDSWLAHKDVPCTLTLQFLLRGGELHLVTSMRSSDLILGIAYDIPAFTLFQEMMANELGVEPGAYVHVSNSLHLYSRHFGMARAIADSNITSYSDLILPMPRMPKVVPIGEMMASERELRIAPNRHALLAAMDAACDRVGDNYWCDWMKILASHRAGVIKETELMQFFISLTKFEGYHQFAK